MKKTIIYLLSLVIITLTGCSEEPIGQTPVDSTPPGKITDPQIQNIPGGAIITYQLPQDEDLSFVRAEYMRKGKLCTDHSSVYNNSLTIQGFSTTDPVTVSIYSVDFSMNKSEPVTVTINPERAHIHTIFESIEPEADFAGVYLKWQNDGLLPIGITLLYEEEEGVFVEKETYFSKLKEGEYVFRSFDDVLTKFKVFVRDQWDNVSDTLSFELAPLYEVEVDRSKYRQCKLSFDCTSEIYGAWWALWTNMFDHDTANAWVTALDNNPENDYRFPIMTTIDLGTMAQLSRFRLWMRGDVEFGTGTPKKMEFWGSSTLDTNKPRDYWASDERGTWKNDWVYLGDYEIKTPSGSSVATDEDKVWAKEHGFEFKFPLNEPVRYVRLLVNNTWSGAKFLEVGELVFYGNDKIE